MPSTQAISLPQIRVADVDFFKPVHRATAVATAVTAADWDAGVKAIGNNIPGYRYSATFLSSLRSNLHLSASSPISPSSSLPPTPTGPAFLAPPFSSAPTPPSPSPLSSTTASVSATSLSRSRKQAARSRTSSAAASSSSAVVAAAAAVSHSRTTSRARNSREHEFHDSDGPAVAYRVALPSSTDERSAALTLIAASIVEQRLVAVRAILSRPAVLALVLVLLVVGARFLSYSTLFMVAVGVIAIGLLGVYWSTQRFVAYAQDVGVDWLGGNAPHTAADRISSTTSANANANGNGNGNGAGAGSGSGSSKSEDPTVLIATLPSPAASSSSSSSSGSPEIEIIGALVFRYVKRERKAYIRAWTVARAHRGKGTGEGLLEEAVRMVWGRGCRGVEFERGHAHSHRIPLLTIPTTLPSLPSLSTSFSFSSLSSLFTPPTTTPPPPTSTSFANTTGAATDSSSSSSSSRSSSISHSSDLGGLVNKTATAAAGEGADGIQIDFNAVFDRGDDRAREKLARVVGRVRRDKGSR